MKVQWWDIAASFAKDYGATFSSVALIAVTIWYAVLTRSISKSSAVAAENARVAAEHSAIAAAASVASLDVRLSVTSWGVYIPTDETPPGFLYLVVRCDGASVFVHSGWIEDLHREGRAGDRAIGICFDAPGTRTDLHLFEGAEPIKVHRGQEIRLLTNLRLDRVENIPPELELYEILPAVRSLVAKLLYSLDGSSALTEYQTSYSAERE